MTPRVWRSVGLIVAVLFVLSSWMTLSVTSRWFAAGALLLVALAALVVPRLRAGRRRRRGQRLTDVAPSAPSAGGSLPSFGGSSRSTGPARSSQRPDTHRVGARGDALPRDAIRFLERNDRKYAPGRH
jgi:hypothetical protein